MDGDGFIVNCNSVAETLLKSSCQEIVGKYLSLLMPNTLALQVRDNGQSHIEIEEIFERNNRHFHFIVTAKPVKGQEKPYGVVISFRDIAEARKLVNNLSQNSMIITFDDIIGASGSITKVKNQAFQVAKGNSTILITGGSGTGKEMFARAIHFCKTGGQYCNCHTWLGAERIIFSPYFICRARYISFVRLEGRY